MLSRQALKTVLAGPAPPQTSSTWVQLLHQIEFQPFPRPQPIPEAPRPPKPLRVLIGSQSWPGGEGADAGERGGAGGRSPGGEVATAQAWMEKATQTNTASPLGGLPLFPAYLFLGLSGLPIAGLYPPPSTSGHVPLAARATHYCALNLCESGGNPEAGAARTARSVAGGEPRPAAAAGPTMTCYRGFLLGSCRRVAGGRAAVLRGPGAGGPTARPWLGGEGGSRRHLGQGQPRELAGCGSRPDGGFRPSRVVVVAKTTRYEFEQQRYRYAELSEEDLKQLVGPGGPRSCVSAGPRPATLGGRPRPLGRDLSGQPFFPGRPRCQACPARYPPLPPASLVGSPLLRVRASVCVCVCVCV